jgi:hypothetical protein
MGELEILSLLQSTNKNRDKSHSFALWGVIF